MKKEIHPKYHEVVIRLTNGSEFRTRSTYGKPGAILKLDVDPLTHPAWTGKHALMENSGQLSKFRDRFGSLDKAFKV